MLLCHPVTLFIMSGSGGDKRKGARIDNLGISFHISHDFNPNVEEISLPVLPEEEPVLLEPSLGPELLREPSETVSEAELAPGLVECVGTRTEPVFMVTAEPFLMEITEPTAIEAFSTPMDNSVSIPVIEQPDEDLDPELIPEPQLAQDTQEVDLNNILDMLKLEDNDKELEVEADVPYDIDIDITEKNQPIYKGAGLTLHQSFVSILTMVLAFKLSGVCLKAILSLISIHLPQNNIFKSSVTYFKKYFSSFHVKKEYLYFCSVCFAKCEKTGCVSHVSAKLCYLVKLPLIAQLQMLFNREGFYDKLKFKNFSHTGSYSDIYNGNIYQEGLRDGYLGHDGKISFNWYTDGVALYKSSNTSVWPFYLTINELPYKDRFKKENILLPVVWVGPIKPPANILISEVYPDLKVLSEGVKLNVANVGEKNIQCHVISGSGDTPARSMMMDIVQFNGASSCQRCEQPGESRVDNPGVRIFPFNEDQMTPRTVERMLQFGALAKPKKPYVGIKSVPRLNLIMSDCVRGVSIDPMHQIYGGCCKRVLRLLTEPSKEKYCFSKQVETINERLLSIRPPAHTARVPRSLTELAYWKMKELKSFLHDYSLPVLKDLLPTNYFKHHATLVAGVQLLSADVVSPESLETAKKLFQKYVSQIPDLYNLNIMTMNHHLLLHLHEVVRDLGPLWVYTCFPMEDINGVILNLVHGTRWAESQIGDSVQTCLALPELVRNLEMGTSKTFCKTILERSKCVTFDKVKNSKIVGKCIKLPEAPSSLQDIFDINEKKVYEVRSIKRGIFIYEALSKQVPNARRDSTAVAYEHQDTVSVGRIQNLYRVFECNCSSACSCESKVLGVVQKLNEVYPFPTLIEGVCVPNIAEYSETSNSIVIDAEYFCGVCTQVKINDSLYVSKPLNSKELE